MNLTPLTNGAQTNTGTAELISSVNKGGVIGGVLITADGSNDATVILRENNSTGFILFEIVTKSPLFITAPIRSGNTNIIYYSITGTNATAMLYEWND